MDERLTWNPEHYSGLRIIRVPCDKIWLPDIVLYNNADDFTSGYMQSKAMVHSTGTVFWAPPAKLRSTCTIDITYFPFDDQRCRMKFGSWTYDGFQLNMTKKREHVDLENYVHSGEWDLIRIDVVRHEIKYPCCPEIFPDITFWVVMRRRTLYYLFNIIFPCLWLTVLSLLGFWLPPDSGEKITLGITVLLAFSVFMLLIAESMPATSEFVPLIGVYLTAIMATTSLSIVLTVFVLHFHHIGPYHRPMPLRLRRFMFYGVARMLRMRSVEQYLRKHDRASWRSGSGSSGGAHGGSEAGTAGRRRHRRGLCATKHSSVVAMAAAGGSACTPRSATGSRRGQHSPLYQSRVLDSDAIIAANNVELLLRTTTDAAPPPPSRPPRLALEMRPITTRRDTPPRRRNRDNTVAAAVKTRSGYRLADSPTASLATASSSPDDAADNIISPSPPRSPNLLSVPSPTSAPGGGGVGVTTQRRLRRSICEIETVTAHLHTMMGKHEEDAAAVRSMSDWRMLAYVLDRLLFWIFFAIALLSTSIILLVLPATKPTI